MIIYDGVSLESVANVKIEDIKVNPIQYDDVTRVRSVSPGSVFVRSRAGTRTVVVTFALPDDNRINRQGALLAISQWAKTDKEYKIEFPWNPNMYLMGVCTSKPEPSLRMWWESKLRLVFTCFDNPFWTSKVEKRFTGNTTNPITIFIDGNAPPLMRIRRVNSAVSNRSYVLDGETISFTSLPAGEMNIDVNRQIVTVNGVNAMQYYNPSSTFFIPHSGSQSIQGIGYFYYRERWE